MAFPTRAGPRPFPVSGCSIRVLTWRVMRVHFWHRNVWDTMVILEEGNLCHPRRPLCDMMVPWKAMNVTHRSTEHCTWGAERKRQRLAAEEEREVTARDFSAYGRPLEMFTSSKCLGRVVLATNYDCLTVVRNLDQAKTVWSRMSRILGREVETPWVSGLFFKAVIQSVLLFGAETWVVTSHMGKSLGGFRPIW